jgi:glutaminyl-tRNA synthetase
LEFARLELDRGLTSKRKVNALVKDGSVDGFDDPRLATLSGLRRRGFTASSVMAFIDEAGISKANSTTPFSRLEDFLRIELDPLAARRFVVSDPVELVIEGEPLNGFVDAPNHPKDLSAGTRPVELSNRWWIDASDIRLAGAAEKGFKRVEPGAVFRIMHASVLECVSVEADANGRPARVVARTSDAKPKATIHGISDSSALPVEIWEPEMVENEEDDPSKRLVAKRGYAEPAAMTTDSTFHAVRYGYCVVDRNCPGRLILTVKLKSSF